MGQIIVATSGAHWFALLPPGLPHTQVLQLSISMNIFAPQFLFLAANVFLLTPPFTQLNTPYPATAYLKGFLNTRGVSAFQADLGLEVTLDLFSEIGLNKVFDAVDPSGPWSANARRILQLRTAYVQCIEPVKKFLQGKNATLAQLIASRNLLPEAGRFAALTDMHWAFGTMGQQDRAKYLATMFLEDISDLIRECVDEHFGFSRYAEKLGRCANQFDELYEALRQPLSMVDELLVERLRHHIARVQPGLVAITVPFPGNLFAAFRVAQWLRTCLLYTSDAADE